MAWICCGSVGSQAAISQTAGRPLVPRCGKPCAHQGRAVRIDQDMPKINKHYRVDLQKILVELNRGHMVGGWEDVSRSRFRYS